MIELFFIFFSNDSNLSFFFHVQRWRDRIFHLPGKPCEQWLPLGGRNHFRIHTVLRSALCTSRSASLAACLFRARPFITHMTILADGNCLYPVIRTISYAGPLSPTFTIIPRFPAIVASCLEQRPSNRNSVRKI